MKKALILLPLLLLTSCDSTSFGQFKKFYDKEQITAFIESTTNEHVEELGAVHYSRLAQSDSSKDLHTLYVKIDANYIVKFETMHKLKELKWFVEYNYTADYSYENAVSYVPAEWR